MCRTVPHPSMPSRVPLSKIMHFDHSTLKELSLLLVSSLLTETQQMANTQERKGCDQEEEVGKLAVRLANAVVLPMVLKSALELNIIDVLVSAGGFLSPAEIASRIGSKNPGAPVLVDRMMRLLASHGVIEWRARRSDGNGDGDGDGDGGEREYGAGPMCRFLAKDEEGGAVGPLFLLHHDKVFMESWYIILGLGYHLRLLKQF